MRDVSATRHENGDTFRRARLFVRGLEDDRPTASSRSSIRRNEIRVAVNVGVNLDYSSIEKETGVIILHVTLTVPIASQFDADPIQAGVRSLHARFTIVNRARGRVVVARTVTIRPDGVGSGSAAPSVRVGAERARPRLAALGTVVAAVPLQLPVGVVRTVCRLGLRHVAGDVPQHVATPVLAMPAVAIVAAAGRRVPYHGARAAGNTATASRRPLTQQAAARATAARHAASTVIDHRALQQCQGSFVLLIASVARVEDRTKSALSFHRPAGQLLPVTTGPMANVFY